MRIKAIIFDLDGTLICTKPEGRYKLMDKAIKELGRQAVPREHIDQFWFGQDRSDYVRDGFLIEPSAFWKCYDRNHLKSIIDDYAYAYPDVDALSILKKQGYKLGLVTGSPMNIAYHELDLINRQIFSSIVISHPLNGIPAKPHPRGIELCLEMLGAKKEEAIYVGNASEDILAAKNAGVLPVLIERNEHKYKDELASIIINSLYGLCDQLDYMRPPYCTLAKK